MPIVVCGINHKTASITLREKVVFSQEKLPLYLQDLMMNEGLHEAVLLSTCNRSEVYCETDNAEKIKNWFCRQHAATEEELKKALYLHKDQHAIEHIMQVASGLDSMVLGESQILGQMKQAFSESCAAGSVGPLFNRLFQQVFYVVKEVRNASEMGACPMSIASAATQFIKHIFPSPLEKASLLLVGAGSTIQLVLRHLKPFSSTIFITNRHDENADLLTKEYGGKSISFSRLEEALNQVDIIVAATGSAQPLITKKMIKPREKPLFIIDLAVPRNVESDVATYPHVSLYSIDDLKNILQQNRMKGEHAAEKARDMIKQKSGEFMAWLDSFHLVASTIHAYRQQIKNLCDAELTKSLRRLQNGENATDVLTHFAHAFTNKLLHTPSVQLREAGLAGRFDILQLARELLAIPHPESEIS